MRIIFLALVFLLHAAQTYGQPSRSEYLIDQWDTERGLPQNSVTSILQTRDGYLWLGSFGGLVRFDGINFEVFNLTSMPGMRSERVLVLYEDRRGALWFGTEGGGAGRLAHGTFSMFGISEGLPGEVVTSFAEDSAGMLWVGTRDGGLATIVNDSASSSWANDLLPDKGVKSIVMARGGDIWVCTEVLSRFHGRNITTYIPGRDIPGTQINSIMEDSEQRLWVGTTDGGLVRHAGGRFESVWLRHQSFPENIWKITEDHRGRLWLSSSRGLYQFEQNQVISYGKRDGMGDLFVRSVFEDREGNLWVGTNTGGLHRFRVSVFHTLAQSDGLPVENITSMAEGADGRVWIGLQCGGVSVWQAGLPADLFAGTKAKGRFSPQAGKITNMVGVVIKDYGCVWSVYEDSRGYLWIGSWGGSLQRWKSGALDLYDEHDGLRSKIVLATYEDDDGTMWFGTLDQGLVKFDGKRFQHFTTDDGLTHNDVRSILRDRFGNLWIGTAKGVSRYSGGTFTSYTSTNGFVDASVRVIYEDDDGVLWFGTYGKGLVRYLDGKFTPFTMEEGLFDNVISQILEDNSGNFFMGSNRGIARVTRKDLNAFVSGEITRIPCAWYESSDGLNGRETNGGFQPAGLKTKDGRLWFPTVRGIAILDPSTLERNSVPPPVVIQKVLVDGVPEIRTDPAIGGTTLSYNHKRVEFHFAALSYRAPQKNRFQSILEGFDREWSDAGQARTISYTSLPPGKYTFRVRASNDAGVWNMAGASLAIVVMPPFWETWWFRAFIIFIFVAAGPAVYYKRVTGLKRAQAIHQEFSKKLIASQEAERKRIANELHDSLGQNLLVIKNKLLLKQQEKNVVPEQLGEVSDLVSNTIQEVRSISHALRPHQLDQLGLTKTLRSLVKSVGESSSLQVNSNIADIDGALIAEEEISLFRIVQESFNNIIKHSGATKVEVNIAQNGSFINVRIEDNGKGISSPAGFGISGMQERARMFEWSLSILSEPSRGTTLSLIIPRYHP